MSLRGKQNCVAGNKLPTSYGLRGPASEKDTEIQSTGGMTHSRVNGNARRNVRLTSGVNRFLPPLTEFMGFRNITIMLIWFNNLNPVQRKN
jgi:hypothetical protein